MRLTVVVGPPPAKSDEDIELMDALRAGPWETGVVVRWVALEENYLVELTDGARTIALDPPLRVAPVDEQRHLP